MISGPALAQENNKSLGEFNSLMAKDRPQILSNTSTEFSLKLFEQFAQKSDDNVVISPFSAYIALSMALNGAAGSTSKQMSESLAVSTTIDSLNTSNKSLLTALAKTDGKVQLEIGNAIFCDTSIPFKKSFLDLCQQKYDAEIKNVSFADPSTLESINDWCKNKTNGKIPTIVSKLSDSEKMVILNAVYFKGTWASPFKKGLTQEDEFTTLCGDKRPIKMMNQLENLSYFQNASFQAVAIPYKSNRQSLYVFLPNKKTKWPLFLAEFTQINWNNWLPKFSRAKVYLSLPKFTIRFSQDLSSGLEKIGMAEAFDPDRANFSNMIAPPAKAWISRVLQKTYIDVNEEGTEAAAATAIIMGATMAMVQEPPIEFRVDRPFVLALMDNESKEILFLGSIVKP
jgi:serpin B